MATPDVAQFVLTPSDVGGLSAGVVMFISLVAFGVSKLRKMGKIDGAEGNLYDKLSRQVQEQKEDLDRVYKERNDFSAMVADLKARVGTVDDFRASIEMMRKKLDEKDICIAERDESNRLLMLEILQLKDRIHVLELRLAADEKMFCHECPRMKDRVR